jgi:hypothetical protein
MSPKLVLVSSEDITRATGHEKHAVMVDYDVFVKAGPPTLRVSSDPAQYDLRLRPGAVAVGAGARLPNLNDRFTGDAPPHHGPRTR